MLSNDQIVNNISDNFNKKLSIKTNNNIIELFVEKNDIYNLIFFLKDSNDLKFKTLIDITVVDYPSRDKRFEIIYILLSLNLNKRTLIKTSIKESENLESITSIFNAANWHERECYDLFGIKFNNHPDLRRIMTDYNFEGHPLRKDFPLTGHTEVRYDDLQKKVVYEPVSLSQEYRNFDYSSPWEGLPNDLIGDEKVGKKE